MVIDDSNWNGSGRGAADITAHHEENGVLPTATLPQRFQPEPIAVVGMACRLPGDNNSPHALWEFLERGGIADTTPPASRFRGATHYDGSTKPGTMRSPGGMFLENIDPAKFDAAFFSIGKADAVAMDPQQRQLLEVVYECLENGGVPLEKLDGEAVGVFVGSYAVDYADMQARDPDDRVPSVTIGVGRAILSNRISHFLNVHGPSMTIDTACSGSLVGLDVAARYLATHEIDGALVAGANMYLSPEHVMDSGPMKGASSLSGRCHTFDKKADGYIKAEAVNCVLLKRLADAVRDGDPIRAIIRGTATNSDGKTPGIASPSAEAQAMAARAAYANAGISDLAATGYIEMHGTGTQAGDPQEVKGVASVFAASRAGDAPLVMGSIKSNIGHSEPAAGVSGLIKAVLAVEKGRIPGNPTFIDPNPNIDFEGSRVRATRYTIPWPAATSEATTGAAIRRASVNSFGYGGSNVHVVVDQAPDEMKKFASSFSDGLDLDVDFLDDEDDKPQTLARPHVLLFSANDESSLKAYLASLRKHLLNPRVKIDLPSLAYTLSERRTRHFHRGYLVTQTQTLGSSLDPTTLVSGKKKTQPPKVGFIFTGQGAQWPQMGRALVDTFPEALATIRRLDSVLATQTAHPPAWSLLQELTEPRSPEKLREPEFSQPLVTALQIAILSVLKTWNVHSVAAVGHSSGEIAAAYAAGLLSEADAIKAAYYRGHAVKTTTVESSSRGEPKKMGMMAVGLGSEQVQPYLLGPSSGKRNQTGGTDGDHGPCDAAISPGVVSIACYNSPNSVTLAGPTSALEQVRELLVADSHFARMLQVDMAYHSPFMAHVGEAYVKYLEEEDFSTQEPRVGTGNAPAAPRLFSSVLGLHDSKTPVDIEYWKRNMLQPVLYEQALTQMLTAGGKDAAPDFLIEIGPSGALAGPTGQTKKDLPGGGADIQYCAAMSRGKDAVRALFDVAGRLFIAGHTALDFTAVNNTFCGSSSNSEQQQQPKLLTDLPNYAWNHAATYWYENEASQDWRNRPFAHHDLLGSKVLGTPWQAPAFKKTLRLADLPWLRDHRLGPDVVFPGAGYMAMAIEAMVQTDTVMRSQAGEELKHEQQVRLRNVSFDNAMVLEEGKDTRVMLNLAPMAVSNWFHWTVRSLVGDAWIDHCKGQVRIEQDMAVLGDNTSDLNQETDIGPLRLATPGALWYKSMRDVGYNFGPAFQKLIAAETTSGERRCRSLVDLTPPPSEYAQSAYPLHPAAFDGCMQSCAPGLWKGSRSSVNAVLVPAIIDDVVVRLNKSHHDTSVFQGKQQAHDKRAISVSHSVFSGPGRTELTKNYASTASVYDEASGALVMQMRGLRYHMLDFQDTIYGTHQYSKLVWAPDVTLSPQAWDTPSNPSGAWNHVQEVLDLLAHKKPNAMVVEVSLVEGDSASVWLEGLSAVSSLSTARKAFTRYVGLTTDAASLVEAESRYEGTVPGATSFQLLNMPGNPWDMQISGRSELEAPKEESLPDLVILRLPHDYQTKIDMLVVEQNVGSLLAAGAHVLVLEQKAAWDPQVQDGDEAKTNGTNGGHSLDENYCCFGYKASKIAHVFDGAGSRTLNRGYVVAMPAAAHTITLPRPRSLDIVHFSPGGAITSKVIKALDQAQWDIRELEATTATPIQDRIRGDATILVISELENVVLPSLSPEQWVSLQTLLQMRNRIMWVSRSAQWEPVLNPEGAMIHGLCRSVRTEDPSMRITTLDVEDPERDRSIEAIALLLQSIQETSSIRGVEGEYVERNGILHVSRILGDDTVNTEELARKGAGHVLEERHLHKSNTTIRLIAERVGSIDSLNYVEVSPAPLPLPDNTVEVELYASALNFKDVAVTMGIVPENAHLLGLEGAGVVRRVGAHLRNDAQFHVGQRVLVFEKGTFANRIIATTERTIAIPDWLSFEDAATLPSVYLTALYSLHHLAGIKKGDRVLIHSATGGLGIASIQLCHAVGAEVYATVGNDTKKQFLMDQFGLPAAHIFHSRTAAFGPQLMRETGGYGVDIILNSLTGDLLDASWRCIAEGGTMVELGKKDHLDRNALAMEPFARNASYRCFDMSHKHVTDEVIAVFMKQMMDLINARKVQPIAPVKLFPYSGIPDALRFMRGANHIGKIIISNKEHYPPSSPEPVVQVRPAIQPFYLRPDASYLIVGGLKGLCGSLAVELARHGARSVVVMGRSGYDDPRSQAVLRDLAAEGCAAELVRGDVCDREDVRRAFAASKKPVRGVIQGAMVLRDKPFETMTHAEYHAAIQSKVKGTWNLHEVALEKSLGGDDDALDFFTMLSSISGLIGQPAQANYAAANVFLDNFASFRRGLGLRANSVDLGAIDDVGYMAEHAELIAALDTSAWTPINEALFHSIVRVSIQQQQRQEASISSQLITSIAVPQSPSSRLLVDARFSSLCFGGGNGGSTGSEGGNVNKQVETLKLMLKSGGSGKNGTGDTAGLIVATAVEAVNNQFMVTLRLDEPLEPAKPLSAYGLDSLAAVEFRNWARAILGAELTTLEVTSAPSLLALAEKIVGKMVVG